MSTDYQSRHDFDSMDPIRRGSIAPLRHRIGLKVRARKARLYTYPPSIHSVEDDAPDYDNPHAGHSARRLIERALTERRNAEAVLNDGFVVPILGA